MSFQLLETVAATFTPRRSDDLKATAPAIGWRGEWQAVFLIDEGDYEGEWAMLPDRASGSPYWVPSGDLSDVTRYVVVGTGVAWFHGEQLTADECEALLPHLPTTPEAP